MRTLREFSVSASISTFQRCEDELNCTQVLLKGDFKQMIKHITHPGCCAIRRVSALKGKTNKRNPTRAERGKPNPTGSCIPASVGLRFHKGINRICVDCRGEIVALHQCECSNTFLLLEFK